MSASFKCVYVCYFTCDRFSCILFCLPVRFVSVFWNPFYNGYKNFSNLIFFSFASILIFLIFLSFPFLPFLSFPFLSFPFLSFPFLSSLLFVLPAQSSYSCFFFFSIRGTISLSVLCIISLFSLLPEKSSKIQNAFKPVFLCRLLVPVIKGRFQDAISLA